jgi:hypothetical protein
MSDCSGCNLFDESTCCKQIEKIKLYTKDQCADIDGIWHANGECTKKAGGSYSWDNRSIVCELKPAELKPATNNLGKPCPEGRIQLYTKDECDALGGTWYANGECLKKTGGSFSWDNRPATSEYSVIIKLADSAHEYKMAKSVTVTDSTGNVLFTTDPATKKLNGISLLGGLKDK